MDVGAERVSVRYWSLPRNRPRRFLARIHYRRQLSEVIPLRSRGGAVAYAVRVRMREPPHAERPARRTEEIRQPQTANRENRQLAAEILALAAAPVPLDLCHATASRPNLPRELGGIDL